MNQTDGSTPVAVIGGGRMGRHHARTYSKIPQANLVGVVDPDQRRAEAVAGEFGGKAFASPAELLEAHPGLTAVSIATPTQFHLQAAEPFLERRIACLIEKPLAPTVEQAGSIRDLAKRHGALVQVGHTERFNPAVRAARQLNFTPRFLEIERVSPMTFRSLDVGVVMDMMIHDLDIVLMLADSPLQRVEATGVAVIGDYEDIANARLVFESGCVATLTASRMALKTQRKLRLFSEQGYVNVDYGQRNGWVLTRKDNAAALDQVRGQLERGEDLSGTSYKDLLDVRPLDMQEAKIEQDALTAQLASFLDAVRSATPPTVSAEAGWAAVEAAHRVIQAVHAHHWEDLPGSPLRRGSSSSQS